MSASLSVTVPWGFPGNILARFFQSSGFSLIPETSTETFEVNAVTFKAGMPTNTPDKRDGSISSKMSKIAIVPSGSSPCVPVFNHSTGPDFFPLTIAKGIVRGSPSGLVAYVSLSFNLEPFFTEIFDIL